MPRIERWEAGVLVETIDLPDPDPTPAEVVADRVATARAEVAGFSPTNGTRQAVEALCDALEVALTPGATP